MFLEFFNSVPNFSGAIQQSSEAALQIRSGQRSITAKNPPVTAHIDHLMITVTVCFSKKYFFINITCTSYKLFSTILNLFSWNLNTFTKHKEQVCFLFICLFFTHIKTLFFAIFTGKRQCEVFRNIYFEEHLRTTTSQMTLRRDCLKLCFWIAFKTISVTFKPKL